MPSDAVREEVRLASVVIAHDRQTGCHSFQKDESEALVKTRRSIDIAHSQQADLFVLVDSPHEVNLTLNPQLLGESLHRLGLRSGSYDEEPHLLPLETAHDFDELMESLASDQSTNRHEEHIVFVESIVRAGSSARAGAKNAERNPDTIDFRPENGPLFPVFSRVICGAPPSCADPSGRV